MEVFGFLKEKMDFAITELRHMIQNYDRLEDTDLMDQSSVIFDNIRSCMKIDANLLYPRVQYDPEFADELALSHRLHEDINYILDHSIMIHVDEPFDEYLNRMRSLLHLMEKYRQHDFDTLFPYIDRRLDDEERREIESHLVTQMQHESVPAKDLKFY
jgi:hypothetical protein